MIADYSYDVAISRNTLRDVEKLKPDNKKAMVFHIINGKHAQVLSFPKVPLA